MGVLYVTSDVPKAGRTSLCCALATALHQQGRKVALFKPLTLDKPGTQDTDATFFSQMQDVTTSHSDWPHTLPASGEISHTALTTIQTALGQLASQTDTVIIEGLPLSSQENHITEASANLADALDAHVLAIVRCVPGLEPKMVLGLRDTFGQRLIGVVLNQITRYMRHDTQSRLIPTIENAGMRILGAILEDRLMLAATVGQVVEHLNGRFLLGQEKAGELVEHILIGGMIMEWGANYFGRHTNKAVLVRGDRPDIQMAALGTSTACLILTGGVEPTQYAHYEAQEEEVPLVVVDTDTNQSASLLESLHLGVTVHHPHKVERFQRILAEHVDLETLLASIPG